MRRNSAVAAKAPAANMAHTGLSGSVRVPIISKFWSVSNMASSCFDGVRHFLHCNKDAMVFTLDGARVTGARPFGENPATVAG
jgi:hypothetical protein